MTYRRLAVREDTYQKVMDCKELYVKQNPEMEKIPISHDKIVYEMAKFVLAGGKL